MADTTNYTWTKPDVGGDADAWGTVLNTALDDIDTDLDAAETTAAAASAAAQSTADDALPKAGGVMTGQLDTKTGTVAYASQGTASGAVTVDMDTANVHKLTLSGDVTNVTPSNVPGESGFMDILILDIVSGAYDVTGWAGMGTIEWVGGSAPALNSHDVLLFISYDGGTNWQGSVIQADLS
jgi:hypothetical protein